MEQYRIEYIILVTGHISHGSWHSSKEFIESNVNYLNKEHKGIIDHWVGKRIKQ